MDINELKKMLLNSKNLILSGAPGTGKTFLAKQIAREITNDEGVDGLYIGFCQFHPSYDYTDFVEGLRPTLPDKKNGNIGFKRQDGVFMEFCRRALEAEEMGEEQPGRIIWEHGVVSTDNFDEAWKRLLEYLNRNDVIQTKTLEGKPFFLGLNKSKKGLARYVYDTKQKKKTKTGAYINHDQLYKVYCGLSGVNKRGHDNYRKAVIIMMKEQFGLKDYRGTNQPVTQDNSQKYVFIIDEINRGDIAKIFGELFFAIDPGYRGTKGKVKTQYVNLIPDNDTFKNGFYVPENVYIIGTMNDIDRNVESMDFAIRRRFTWIEIKPEETVDMLFDREKGIPDYAEAAKKCMKAINAKISETDGLGPAYQLGAAYFLKLKDYDGDFEQLWKYNIRPLLNEYLRGLPKAESKLKDLEKIFLTASGLQTETETDNNNPNAEQQ